MEHSSSSIKYFLYFGKWNFLALIFSQKKAFLIFQETEALKTSYTSGSNFPSSKKEKAHSEKTSYISGNGTFYPQA